MHVCAHSMKSAAGPVLAIAAALAGISPAGAQEAEPSLEMQAKATFLYRFADFIYWPADLFPNHRSPVRLCIVGEDPFGPHLDRVIDNHTAAGRTLAVHRIHEIGPGSGCHVAYLNETSAREIAHTLAAIDGEPVLTITDAALQDETPGVIHLEAVDGQIRFHIDEARADRGGLEIDSRLMGVAQSVRRTPS